VWLRAFHAPDMSRGAELPVLEIILLINLIPQEPEELFV
jgi:hypothetical protein